MSESYWDACFDRPLPTREGRHLRTLRDAHEFIRARCAYPGHPLATATLSALHVAAQSGGSPEARRAQERTARLMRINRWGGH